MTKFKVRKCSFPLFVILFLTVPSFHSTAFPSNNESQSHSPNDFSVSINSGKEPLTVVFKNKISNNGVSDLFWDFGDGTSSSDNHPVHTFKDSGNYSVTLFINYDEGKKEQIVKENLINVSKRSAPLADFSAFPVSGKTPLTVSFIDESKGVKLSSWMWDFGNGNVSSDQNPIITYKTSGIYTVKLTVSNSLGAHLERKTNFIRVEDEIGPTSAFKATPLITSPNNEITFVNYSSGKIDSLLWDFGDGSTSTENNPKHSYSKTGLFDIKLTVTDENGGHSITEKEHIRVIEN